MANIATRQLRTATIGANTYRFNSAEKIVWDNLESEDKDLNKYTIQGTYEISGVKNANDNIPGAKTNDTFSARLFVLVEDDNTTNRSYHVTQHIIISSTPSDSNSKEYISHSYTRSKLIGTDSDTDSDAWTKWSRCMGIVEDNEIDEIVESGVYEGVSGGEQYILFVIKNICTDTRTKTETIAQFKYSIDYTTGNIKAEKRSYYNDGTNSEWNPWEDITTNEDITKKIIVDKSLDLSKLYPNKKYVAHLEYNQSADWLDIFKNRSTIFDNKGIVTKHIKEHFVYKDYSKTDQPEKINATCYITKTNNNIYIIDCYGKYQTGLAKNSRSSGGEWTATLHYLEIPLHYTYILENDRNEVTIESNMEMDITDMVCAKGVKTTGQYDGELIHSYPTNVKELDSKGFKSSDYVYCDRYYMNGGKKGDGEDSGIQLDIVNLVRSGFIREDIKYKMNLGVYGFYHDDDDNSINGGGYQTSTIHDVHKIDETNFNTTVVTEGRSTYCHKFLNLPKFIANITDEDDQYDKIFTHIINIGNHRVSDLNSAKNLLSSYDYYDYDGDALLKKGLIEVTYKGGIKVDFYASYWDRSQKSYGQTENLAYKYAGPKFSDHYTYTINDPLGVNFMDRNENDANNEYSTTYINGLLNNTIIFPRGIDKKHSEKTLDKIMKTPDYLGGMPYVYPGCIYLGRSLTSGVVVNAINRIIDAAKKYPVYSSPSDNSNSKTGLWGNHFGDNPADSFFGSYTLYARCPLKSGLPKFANEVINTEIQKFIKYESSEAKTDYIIDLSDLGITAKETATADVFIKPIFYTIFDSQSDTYAQCSGIEVDYKICDSRDKSMPTVNMDGATYNYIGPTYLHVNVFIPWDYILPDKDKDLVLFTCDDKSSYNRHYKSYVVAKGPIVKSSAPAAREPNLPLDDPDGEVEQPVVDEGNEENIEEGNTQE